MTLDYKKIKSGLPSAKPTDPRKIFTTLKRDTTKFKRPSDEQGDVLDAWYGKRTRADNTLKMNTGSGKTVVGLLCLQSSLNEGVGPAVYVTPDKYLLHQVVAEAESLGIAVTEDEHDAAFVSGTAILVINIWKLVNGRSVFGVGRGGTKIEIGSLVIDDAHACLATVADQFKIRLSSDHPAYAPLLELFRPDLENQSASAFLDIADHDPQIAMAVPFWAWKNKQSDVLRILHPHRGDEALKWPWRLVEDVLELCQCAFGGGSVEIAPRFIPIDNIPAFTGAKRRIYMTATLADDGVLVSHFQADAEQVADPIRPKGGGDIGDRMILAPQEINPDITVEEVKALVAAKAKTINVAVIVPSNKRAEFWADVANQTLTADSIEEGTDKLRKGHVGLTVFVGKYDGVDLPAKACEILVIDGLPELYGLIERIEQEALDGTHRLLVRQVQRIEQGMGRGVRSSQDHCVVLLMGSKLTQRLHRPDARILFSSATRAQLDLGREVTAQLKSKPLSEIASVMDLCLTGDDEWLDASRSAVVNADAGDASHVDETVVALRKAFDFARSKRFDLAEQTVQEAARTVTEKKALGYLKQQLAEYVHHTDQVKAQELQLAAVQLNRALVRPVSGIAYNKLSVPKDSQAASAVAFMKRFLEKNDLIMWVNALNESLAWGEENSKKFESAMLDLGLFLGFGSQRPEQETGRGPDNLWALGALKYLVIECKSGAVKASAINKHDCNQLNGSMAWFAEKYDKSCSATPVMVHPKIVPEHAATLHADARIVTQDCLARFAATARSYSVAISQKNGYADAKVVADQLNHFGLTLNDFVTKFTVRSKKS
ncbi:hypothetical protein NLM31_07100 [Bradyrhizobium sp. CCGUVB4N]|uniref:helicase C-terminal domain-containing protein n=1 Tax=Bradyrhizobium sp. CCGUVB4N TaxID=2949631 RepID=UPI0020B2DA3F|nr:helicase C-terminal domain-containing protein [Bradyrhizobium sp. CCGUVB4N]MCP3380177.1 hypothetical protein [Bradyrhizobium sp. CCGUVB4N]